MRTVSTEVGRALYAAGVRYAFGHPGGEVVELIEGLRAEGIEFVLTHHETAGAFMADAIGSSTGVPGVCVGTLGPGATNLITGAAQAHLDRAPMIVLTGQLAATRSDIVTHQKIDLGALFEPVTKWHAQVNVANVRPVMARAIRVATEHRPGPVHLEIASDIAGLEVAESSAPTVEARVLRVRHFPPEAAEDVNAALNASERPVAVVGMDAADPAVSRVLAEFIHAWSMPVVVTPKAKGTIREDDPHFLGTLEALGTSELYKVLDDSDLLVLIGLEPVELDRDWLSPGPAIHIGPAANHDQYFGATIELVGPIDAALDLIQQFGPAVHKWDLATIASMRGRFREHTRGHASGLAAQDVVQTLRAVLPEDALMTCDVGQNKSVAGQSWAAFKPRTFHVSNGLSSMGYGLPAAIGLQLVNPDLRVGCVTGDGGLGMCLAEVETAVRLNLPIVIVVLVDHALTQIKMHQTRRGYAPTGTEFGPMDFVAIARAMGADGREVTTIDDCREAVEWATTRTGPTLIAAQIDPACYLL